MSKTDLHTVTEPKLILQDSRAEKKSDHLPSEQIISASPEESITLTDSNKTNSPKGSDKESFAEAEIPLSPRPSPSNSIENLESTMVPKDFKLKEAKAVSRQEAKVILKLEPFSQRKNY